MSDPKDLLTGHPVTSSLTSEEVGAIAAKLTVKEFAEGEDVSLGDETTHEILFVIEGAVEVIAPISDDVERIIETARAGATLGQVTFFDRKDLLGLGRAIEDTRCLVLKREAFDELCREHPATALHLQSYLVDQLCARVRILGAQYIHSVAWGLQISGAVHLNLQRIITDQAVVVLDLVSGKTVSGTLLSVDSTDSGNDIYLREIGGDLIIVPWSSVTVAKVPGKIVDQMTADGPTGRQTEQDHGEN